MIANSIAYLITAFFLILGIFGFCQFASDNVPAEKEGGVVLASFLLIVAAWICAKIGGI